MSHVHVVHVSPTATIRVLHVGGDLTVGGEDSANVTARVERVEDLQMRATEAGVEITCDDDCELHVPRQASVHIVQVEGDARVVSVAAGLQIQNVGGDLDLRNVGSTTVQHVGDDLTATHVRGALEIGHVDGDATISHVAGAFSAARIEDDLELLDVAGGVAVEVGDDATLVLAPIPGCTYAVRAEGDIECRVPADAGLAVHLHCGGRIRVKKLQAPEVEHQDLAFTLGSGAATLRLDAGGDILLAGRESASSAAPEFSDAFAELGVGVSSLAQQLAKQVETQVKAVAQQIDEKLSQLNDEEFGVRVQEKVQSAMRRAEQKMAEAMGDVERRLREADRRMAEMQAKQRSQNPPWPAAPQPPKPSKLKRSGVSDEERMAILRMLEQGTITVEQAEKLLEALQ